MPDDAHTTVVPYPVRVSPMGASDPIAFSARVGAETHDRCWVGPGGVYVGDGTVDPTLLLDKTGLRTGAVPIGYGTGAGGAVTQITTIATGVTLSKLSGQITTVASTLAALSSTGFVVTNTLVAATDVIVLSTTYAGNGTPLLQAIAVGAGVFTISIANGHATAALNAALVINFAVIKAAAA